MGCKEHSWVGKMVKRYRHFFYNNGEMNQRNMRKISINEDDLMESVRREINSDSLEEVKHIFIEKQVRSLL